jgi:hypothetical protein
MSGWGDVPTIQKYYSLRKFGGSVLRNHLLLPWFRHRGELQERYLHDPNLERKELIINRFGWWTGVPETIDSASRAAATERVRNGFSSELSDQFQVSAEADKAMRNLLSQCRTEGISAAFILMPEGESFRSWYSPMAEQRLQEFLNGLSATYQVPIFDTRKWFDDSYFADSHHLLRDGARAFTLRFEREILRPLIKGSANGEWRIANGESKTVQYGE